MLRRGLRLVQSLQRAVVPLVQPPVLGHGDPELIHLVERDVQRLDGALQYGCECQIEHEARLLHQPARFPRFGAPLLGKIDVLPAGESVFLIPGGLTVS